MVYSLFFISGISGLIFEVIWVRQFGNLFGNTIHSASIVTSVFMFGLGVGSLITGMLSDKKYGADPKYLLKLYAYFEIAIGITGLLYALLFTKLEFLSPFISNYIVGPEGWFELSAGSYLSRYALAVILLTPVTLLMGGTLTILIRFLVAKDIGNAGWKIGALYAANTAGASIGCFSVDFLLIPNIGLLGAQSLAVVLNLIAGFGAFRLYSLWTPLQSKSNTSELALKEEKIISPEPNTPQSRYIICYITLAIFLSGFAGMGMEIIWFRFLSSILGALRSTFSLMLTVILIGIWIGSIVGGYLSRRFGSPALFFLVFQGLFASSTIIMFLFFSHNAIQLFQPYHQSSNFVKWLMGNWINLRAILLLVGLPAFFMGSAYPLANAIIQHTEAVVGKRAGLLYLSNTVGAVLGSVCSAFLFLTNLGIQNSILLLSFFSLLAIIFLYIAFQKSNQGLKTTRISRTMAAGSGIALIICLIIWNMQAPDYILKKIYSGKKLEGKTLLLSEGLTESIAITETPRGVFGKNPERILYVDGILMSGTFPFAQRYMRAFSHIPLLDTDQAKRVLVICFGIGNTAHAASLYPTIEKIEVVDLSKHILRHSRYFSNWNHNILQDSRVYVYINDGRQHLRMQNKNIYDLITLEPPPIASAGVVSLYSKEFYQLVNSRLKEGGFLSQWLPAYQVKGHIAKSMVRAFIEVFPNSVLLSGNQTHLIMVGRKNRSIVIDPVKLNARIQSNPAVQDDLKQIFMGSLTELIGTFAASYNTMAKAVQAAHPVTDDYPIMEYSTTTYFYQEVSVPATLFNVNEVDIWCPKCFKNGKPISLVKNLDSYLFLLGQWYKSPNFQVFKSYRKNPPFQLKVSHNDGNIVEAYQQSQYLKNIFSNARKNQ